jgi:hypothetical protein
MQQVLLLESLSLLSARDGLRLRFSNFRHVSDFFMKFASLNIR